MKTLLVRSTSGLVFVIVLIGSILLNPFIYMGLMSILTLIGSFELYKMFSKSTVKPQIIVGSIVSLLVYFVIAYITSGIFPLSIAIALAPLLMIAFIVELFRHNENPIQNIAITLLPSIYVAIPFGLTNFLRNESYFTGYQMLIAFFVLIWTFDSFAYLTGVSIGKHRMMERVSPKKSWEGFAGGIIFSMIAGYVIGLYFNDLTSLQWAFFALLVGVFGTIGDLIESMMKRAAGIKDSGKIMPGHGGVLDRFDAVLLLSPIIVTYLLLINLFE